MAKTARRVIDADFEFVSGPMRAGDEHPTRKGWFLTDIYRKGVRQWYRPPGLISRWIRRIAIVLWLGMILTGIIATIVSGGI